MSLASAQSYPDADIEQLLSGLAGVISARVVSNAHGRLDEIHILASDRLHPKQIVRNVESALCAGFGLTVDRRAISVAQTTAPDAISSVPLAHLPLLHPARPATSATAPSSAGAGSAQSGRSTGSAADASQAPNGRDQGNGATDARASNGRTSNGPTSDGRAAKPKALAAKPDLRFIYVGFDVRNATNRETVCHVTVRREREHYIGTGTGASTPQGRALAAAKGLISAIATARDRGDIALEDAAIVEAHGRSFVLVAAHVLMRRETIALTGVALLQRSPEEAAILASLQAINRWLSDEG